MKMYVHARHCRRSEKRLHLTHSRFSIVGGGLGQACVLLAEVAVGEMEAPRPLTLWGGLEVGRINRADPDDPPVYCTSPQHHPFSVEGG
jgi:hypothetical protein